MIENEFFPGHVRLPINSKENIKNLYLVSGEIRQPITGEEIDALESVWDLYSNGSVLMDSVQRKFAQLWDGYNSLHQLHIWWDALPYSFNITQIGSVLAHTNARRILPDLPTLD